MARLGPEAVVERHLRRRVEAAGGWCLKFVSTRAGVPDRIVVLNGHVLFVELKAPSELKHGLPALQRVWHERLRRSGNDERLVRVVCTTQMADELVAELTKG